MPKERARHRESLRSLGFARNWPEIRPRLMADRKGEGKDEEEMLYERGSLEHYFSELWWLGKIAGSLGSEVNNFRISIFDWGIVYFIINTYRLIWELDR